MAVVVSKKKVQARPVCHHPSPGFSASGKLSSWKRVTKVTSGEWIEGLERSPYHITSSWQAEDWMKGTLFRSFRKISQTLQERLCLLLFFELRRWDHFSTETKGAKVVQKAQTKSDFFLSRYLDPVGGTHFTWLQARRSPFGDNGKPSRVFYP